MEGIDVSVQVIAKMMHMTERRVQQLAKQGVINKSERGKYNLLSVSSKYIEYLQLQTNEEKSDLQTEKTRLTYHQANIEGLKEDQLRGSLIPENVIREHGAGMVSAFRSKMLALTTKIRNRFSDLSDDVIDEIQRLITEALEELGSDGIPAEVRERIRRNLLSSETAPEPDD